MEADVTYKYAVAFIFDASLERVLLVHKNRPEWQRDKWNGVGGKYEAGETGAACIARETREEAALDIQPKDWIFVGALHQPSGDMSVWTARYGGASSDARALTDEPIEWHDTVALPASVVENIRWMIPLCKEKLTQLNGTFSSFDVTYGS